MFDESTLIGLIFFVANLRFLRGFNFADDQFLQILRRFNGH